MADQVFPVHRDDRGELVVVEGADVGFPIRRVFTVSGVDGGGSRGGHRADCTELLVLVAGTVTVRLRRAGQLVAHALGKPGDSITIEAMEHVDYDLGGDGSVIMVLCEEPYRRQR
jgi:hypothetical protein